MATAIAQPFREIDVLWITAGLVVEGSLPNEQMGGPGVWAALGTDHQTGAPIATCAWADKLAPGALAVIAAGTCATDGGIPAMEGDPTGAMGLRTVNVPGCPVQPDDFTQARVQAGPR